MSRLDASQIIHVMTQEQPRLARYLQIYLPTCLQAQFDQPLAFTTRILQSAQTNLSQQSSRLFRFSDFRRDALAMDAGSRFILSHAGRVPLRAPITEPHAAIQTTGQIQFFAVPVPQPTLSWHVLPGHRLQCWLQQPGQPKVVVQTWD